MFFIERAVALMALVLVSPLSLAIACAIVIEDGKPILFRQTRIGLLGRPFQLVKFRSMCRNASGIQLTARGDRRITKAGMYLRRYKLDELPQLWNIVLGDIRLIGPRPEVPAFVDAADPLWRSILLERPGITSVATLLYRNEEELLSRVGQPEEYYRQVLLPEKLRINLDYSLQRNFRSDVKLVVLTVLCSFLPWAFDPQRLRRLIVNRASNS
jgi:lipopolysaccharide/colanic/teichoic acid biosynthesis glycosyltransferase